MAKAPGTEGAPVFTSSTSRAPVAPPPRPLEPAPGPAKAEAETSGLHPLTSDHEFQRVTGGRPQVGGAAGKAVALVGPAVSCRHRDDGEVGLVPHLRLHVLSLVPLLAQSISVETIFALTLQSHIASRGYSRAGLGRQRGLLIDSWGRRELWC